MKYQLTIRELTPYTEDEVIEMNKRTNPYNGFRNNNLDDRYSDKPYHQTRVLDIEVTREEMNAIKKAVIDVI